MTAHITSRRAPWLAYFIGPFSTPGVFSMSEACHHFTSLSRLSCGGVAVKTAVWEALAQGKVFPFASHAASRLRVPIADCIFSAVGQ